MVSQKDALKLMKVDLARSHLRDSEIKKLKLTSFGSTQTEELTGQKIPSYKIPYFDLQGEELDSFFRMRYLGETKQKGFGAKAKKAQRYTQPPNMPPRFYLPPININWEACAKSTDTLLITEGEKKAAVACLHNLPCIGLGGVWNFSAKRYGKEMIDDFHLFDWTGRKVIFCYDSDVVTNPQVIKAMNTGANMLLSLGAKVYIARLPTDTDLGPKIGLDDFIKEYGYKEFKKIVDAAEAFKGSEALWEMNDHVAYIENLMSFCRLDNMTFMGDAKMINMVYANNSYVVVDADSIKERNTAKDWIKWPNRRTHTDIVYRPGEPVVTDLNELNMWRTWGCEPVEGDIEIFLEFYDYICTGLTDRQKQWLWKWLAYPLQNPGAKILSYVLFWSNEQGVGKTFLGEIIGRIYGENFAQISNTQLHEKFNYWMSNKQFVLAEEIHVRGKKETAEIKNTITKPLLSINKKFAPTYEIDNTINFMFTSNEMDAMYIEKFDRRGFIHEVVVKKKAQAFYRALDRWARGSGPSHLFWYLLHCVNTKSFNPKAEPPGTEAKESMKDASRSDLDEWAMYLYENADHVLVMDNIESDRDLFTLDELKHFMPEEIRARKPTNIALSKSLRRTNSISDGRSVRTVTGVKKLWAVRNQDIWEREATKDWGEHYSESSTYKYRERKKRKM